MHLAPVPLAVTLSALQGCWRLIKEGTCHLTSWVLGQKRGRVVTGLGLAWGLLYPAPLCLAMSQQDLVCAVTLIL